MYICKCIIHLYVITERKEEKKNSGAGKGGKRKRNKKKKQEKEEEEEEEEEEEAGEEKKKKKKKEKFIQFGKKTVGAKLNRTNGNETFEYYICMYVNASDTYVLYVHTYGAFGGGRGLRNNGGEWDESWKK